MDLVLLLVLSLCGWSTADRSMWSNKPDIIISSSDIADGETVTITCTVPIDYRGGDCRLFRKRSRTPFRLMTATDYLCDFHLSSQELLGQRPVGSRVSFTCDYHIQQFTSVSSDSKSVMVWGSSPSPGLSVSRRLLSPEDRVEVTCSPPLPAVSSCHFYRDEVHVARGACSRNLTGKQLAVWEKPALLLPVNLTCRYDPQRRLRIRSEPSDRRQLFVIDVSRVVTSMDCDVRAEDEATASEDRRTFVRPDGLRVTVQVTNGSVNESCRDVQSGGVQSGNVQSGDVQSGDVQSVQSGDVQSGGVQSSGVQSGDP